MSKFKKKYEHNKDDVIDACGFHPEEYNAIVDGCMKILENPDNLSHAIENIEKSCEKYNKDMILRFFIVNFVITLVHKDQDNFKEFLKKVIVAKTSRSGGLDILKEFEIIENPIEENCDVCTKKDKCNKFTKH